MIDNDVVASVIQGYHEHKDELVNFTSASETERLKSSHLRSR